MTSTAWRKVASVRPQMVTTAPSPAKRRAAPRPIPDPPPVTSPAFPFNHVVLGRMGAPTWFAMVEPAAVIGAGGHAPARRARGGGGAPATHPRGLAGPGAGQAPAPPSLGPGRAGVAPRSDHEGGGGGGEGGEGGAPPPLGRRGGPEVRQEPGG